jgi:hypothetical protein
MTVPGRPTNLIVFLATLAFAPAAWSYGGGGGGSSGCDDPKFLNPIPANNSSVSVLTEFSFLASDTDAATLVVQIDGATVPTTINPMRNGDLQVKVRPPAPIDHPGKVRITAQGKSKDGCAGFTAFYIDVKP